MNLLQTREFHYVNVDFYVDGKDFWVTREQIGKMLNYRSPERSIKLLQERYEWHFNHLYKEVELNIRYKGISKVVVYNFDGLLEICSFSGKPRSAEVVNFLWQVKQELETRQPSVRSEVQLYRYGDQTMRVQVIDGEPWFVGKDVAEALGYAIPRKAIIDHVDAEDKKPLSNLDEFQITPPLNGLPDNTVLINESGVYSLIFSSQLPTAKKFKRWVTSEVLPQIRRTGSYSIDAKKGLPVRAEDTSFYSALEIGGELGMSDIEVAALASEKDLLKYGFTRDCEWYFTAEGREKIRNAARI